MPNILVLRRAIRAPLHGGGYDVHSIEQMA